MHNSFPGKSANDGSADRFLGEDSFNFKKQVKKQSDF